MHVARSECLGRRGRRARSALIGYRILVRPVPRTAVPVTIAPHRCRNGTFRASAASRHSYRSSTVRASVTALITIALRLCPTLAYPTAARSMYGVSSNLRRTRLRRTSSYPVTGSSRARFSRVFPLRAGAVASSSCCVHPASCDIDVLCTILAHRCIYTRAPHIRTISTMYRGFYRYTYSRRGV